MPRNYNHRPGSGSGFGKRCREAGEREEKRTVHEDVTESPGASTSILVKVAPGPIQAPGLEVPCGARIREVLQQTASGSNPPSVLAPKAQNPISVLQQTLPEHRYDACF